MTRACIRSGRHAANAWATTARHASAVIPCPHSTSASQYPSSIVRFGSDAQKQPTAPNGVRPASDRRQTA